MAINKPAMMHKKRKNPYKLEKEMRARKRMRFTRYVKHQESPVWVEEYTYPQYDSCEPADWLDVYDENDWQPCGDCHDCGKRYGPVPSGWEELTFEHVNSR